MQLEQVQGRVRVVVLDVQPVVDNGRFPVKRIAGDAVAVSCDLLVDGHDKLAGVLVVQDPEGTRREDVPLSLLAPGSDRWGASFTPDRIGLWHFTVQGWVDTFATWQWGLQRKLSAGVDVSVEVLDGVNLIRGAALRADGPDAAALEKFAEVILACRDGGSLGEYAEDLTLTGLMYRYADRGHPGTNGGDLPIQVDRPKARFSSWYEVFPRSLGAKGKHGTFADVIRTLPYVADMGFDVLYLPPIHPIGDAHRKGPNNTLSAAPEDPGSPWAIGSAAGGHKEIHPQLGSLEDFAALVAAAQSMGIEIAIDIAFQASPDHPYVASHPEWFIHKADGTIQYAENPPKKYQDVYPFALSGDAWQSLWEELHDVFVVWVQRGVRIFRVDNPHTKPLPFWQWCVARLKQRYPDLIFLAEAFTRPKLMYALAKVGFSQSYTYFTWRTSSAELRGYLEELTRPGISDFFRPNFWPNTPDILPEHLQSGHRATFIARLILAGTLTANYGMYGPVYELMEHVARPGSEEYIDNEKFQLRVWDLDRPDSLRFLVKRLNQIRHGNPALQQNETLAFHNCDNPTLLAYSKSASANAILTVVNLDPVNRQAGWLDLRLDVMGIQAGRSFAVHDLLTGSTYQWHGNRAYVELQPQVLPAHIFVIERTEHP